LGCASLVSFNRRLWIRRVVSWTGAWRIASTEWISQDRGPSRTGIGSTRYHNHNNRTMTRHQINLSSHLGLVSRSASLPLRAISTNNPLLISRPVRHASSLTLRPASPSTPLGPITRPAEVSQPLLLKSPLLLPLLAHHFTRLHQRSRPHSLAIGSLIRGKLHRRCSGDARYLLLHGRCGRMTS